MQGHSGIPSGSSDGESRERRGHTQGNAVVQAPGHVCAGEPALQTLRLLEGAALESQGHMCDDVTAE